LFKNDVTNPPFRSNNNNNNQSLKRVDHPSNKIVLSHPLFYLFLPLTFLTLQFPNRKQLLDTESIRRRRREDQVEDVGGREYTNWSFVVVVVDNPHPVQPLSNKSLNSLQKRGVERKSDHLWFVTLSQERIEFEVDGILQFSATKVTKLRTTHLSH
jgi:hypothetical protein